MKLAIVLILAAVVVAVPTVMLGTFNGLSLLGITLVMLAFVRIGTS
jgi:hypothetical protein